MALWSHPLFWNFADETLNPDQMGSCLLRGAPGLSWSLMVWTKVTECCDGQAWSDELMPIATSLFWFVLVFCWCLPSSVLVCPAGNSIFWTQVTETSMHAATVNCGSDGLMPIARYHLHCSSTGSCNLSNGRSKRRTMLCSNVAM